MEFSPESWKVALISELHPIKSFSGNQFSWQNPQLSGRNEKPAFAYLCLKSRTHWRISSGKSRYQREHEENVYISMYVPAWFGLSRFLAWCSTFDITRNKSIRMREANYHNNFPRQFAGDFMFSMTTGLIPLNITKPSVEGLLNAHQITVIAC